MTSSNSNSTILLIHDAPDHLELMSTLLRQAGYEVLTARDALAGLDLARLARPDLVVSDVSMPHTNGIELCPLIRADTELQTTPILLVSAFRKDADSIVEGLQTGADDYLEAPYYTMVFVTLVARLLDVRRVNEELERRVAERTAQLEAASRALEEKIDERRQIDSRSISDCGYGSSSFKMRP